MLIDNSAWARLASGAVDPGRAAEIAEMVEARTLGVCTPFLLEAGYSARNARDHAVGRERFGALPFFAMERPAEERALDAQAQLARAGHHRVPIVDLLIAAIADRNGLGVLHYDSDYEVILERTELSFESVWLAPRGSL